jgi:hypothetical protein
MTTRALSGFATDRADTRATPIDYSRPARVSGLRCGPRRWHHVAWRHSVPAERSTESRRRASARRRALASCPSEKATPWPYGRRGSARRPGRDRSRRSTVGAYELQCTYALVPASPASCVATGPEEMPPRATSSSRVPCSATPQAVDRLTQPSAPRLATFGGGCVRDPRSTSP